MELLSVKEVLGWGQGASFMFGFILFLVIPTLVLFWETYDEDGAKLIKGIVVTFLILIFILNICLFNVVLDKAILYKYHVTNPDKIQKLLDDGYSIYSVEDGSIYEFRIEKPRIE